MSVPRPAHLSAAQTLTPARREARAGHEPDLARSPLLGAATCAAWRRTGERVSGQCSGGRVKLRAAMRGRCRTAHCVHHSWHRATVPFTRAGCPPPAPPRRKGLHTRPALAWHPGQRVPVPAARRGTAPKDTASPAHQVDAASLQRDNTTALVAHLHGHVHARHSVHGQGGCVRSGRGLLHLRLLTSPRWESCPLPCVTLTHPWRAPPRLGPPLGRRRRRRRLTACWAAAL